MAVKANIKMYKVGELGDCFLLRFTNGTEKSHILIDCGSFRNGGESITRMNEIADDVKTQLKTDKLNAIVATHQHNDHVSGFVHARDKFTALKPEQIWLSWLDDPGYTPAQVIGKQYNNYLSKLHAINKKIQQLGKGELQERLNALLGFYGFSETVKGAKTKTDKLPAEVPKQGIANLRKMIKGKPEYMHPGSVLQLPGLSKNAVKVYVLGPPKDEKSLFDMTANASETFDPHLAMYGRQANKFLSALDRLTLGAKKLKEDPYPFDEPFKESGNFDAVDKTYYSEKNKWRAIDNDWLNQAERLALWLDDYTNNSSLVLAFELVKSKKVLLFAADAQTGNWNSWKTIKWKGAPKGFSWLNLMNNTVLYKTGHHGSHNSTLVEGLNNMTHNELVAMIPVDKTDPNIMKKNGWKMPAKNLYAELKKRTQNRIIRMDDGASKSTNWNKLPFKPRNTNLYLEYEVRE